MKKDKTLKGYPPSLTDMNLVLFGQMDPDVPNIPSSKLKEMYAAAYPSVFTKPIGGIVIFSTADRSDTVGFKNIWDDSIDNK